MDELFVAEIGKRILKVRTQLKLSQEELAERANTSKQTVSTAENGKNELRSSSIIKLSDALGVSADYLLKGVPSDSDLVLLDKRIGKLDKEQYEFLSALIDNFLGFVGIVD